MRIQGLVLLVMLGTANWAIGYQQTYPRVHARTSDFCTMGRASLTVEDVALMVRVRRIPLGQSDVENFMSDQEKYFSSKQSRSALFQEHLAAPPGTAQGGISQGWFFFGLLGTVVPGVWRTERLPRPVQGPFAVGTFLHRVFF